jgi:hypothetical protein
MKSIKLYRILQRHVGVMNALAVAVYNEDVEADEALKKAKTEAAKVTAELNEK